MMPPPEFPDAASGIPLDDIRMLTPPSPEGLVKGVEQTYATISPHMFEAPCSEVLLLTVAQPSEFHQSLYTVALAPTPFSLLPLRPATGSRLDGIHLARAPASGGSRNREKA